MFAGLKLSRAIFDKIISAPVFVTLPLADGKDLWQARCSLLIKKFEYPTLSLYSGFGGAGTHELKTIAARKAMCEVLERWAFRECLETPESKVNYCFDIDPSTNGMAAYPEIFPNQVRIKSRSEAVERWALLAWWNGNLSAELLTIPNDISGIRIRTPTKLFFVILWKSETHTAYGFACEPTLKSAIQHAMIELSRNIIVLKNWNKKQLPEDSVLLERRMIFFARQEGQKQFTNAVHNSLAINPDMDSKMPPVIFDNEIVGPWSKYAKVWRTVLKGSTEWDDNTQINLFRF